MNLVGPKAQMRHRSRPGLFRVVNEITLAIKVGVFANDLDTVFVGTNRAI